MAGHGEREQTNQATELTADEMEGVSGGLTFELASGREDHLYLGERPRLLARADDVIE
jgi:hypothetical protein